MAHGHHGHGGHGGHGGMHGGAHWFLFFYLVRELKFLIPFIILLLLFGI